MASGTLTHSLPPLASAAMAAGLLAVVQLRLDPPMLLAERFVPGGGWGQIGLLALYAAVVCRLLLDQERTAATRRRIWTLFSLVFFAQLGIGLTGFDRFLLSGELHVPVPAVVLAGPAFRAGGWFMPVLFAITVLVVGRAWCSYLCYFGSWDLNAAASSKVRPKRRPRWAKRLRLGLLVAVPGVAGAMGLVGMPGWGAAAVGVAFGVVGTVGMAVFSKETGTMMHCTVWCPLGLAANLLGSVSPFRIRIGSSCTDCGACTRVCRYDALGEKEIAAGKPGLSCTLCGDCLAACPTDAIGYRFLGLRKTAARALFVTLAAAVHAVFLAVARI